MKKRIQIFIGATCMLASTLTFGQNQIPASDAVGNYIYNPIPSQSTWEPNNSPMHSIVCPDPVITSNTVCDSGSITLTITNGAECNFWYNDMADLAPFSGDTFHTTPVISSNDTFYVENVCLQGTAITPMPSHSSSYNGTRGYWFVAPVDFVINGLRVPYDFNTGSQAIHIMRFNSAVTYWGTTTTDYVTLGYWNSVADTGFIDVCIKVNAGDTIGIFGVRGGSTSYAPSPNTTMIDTFNVAIQRLGFQGTITSTPAGAVFTESGGSIGRVEMRYSVNVDSSPKNMAVARVGIFTELNHEICDGSSFFVGGANQTTAGVYADTYTSVAGCDSVVGTNLTVKNCSGIENDIENDISLQPNPATNLVNIKSEIGIINNIKIYDVTGKLVYQNSSNSTNVNVNISSLNKGLYHLQLTIGDDIVTKRIIKE